MFVKIPVPVDEGIPAVQLPGEPYVVVLPVQVVCAAAPIGDRQVPASKANRSRFDGSAWRSLPPIDGPMLLPFIGLPRGVIRSGVYYPG
jgi:hypothetical protein